MLAHRFLASTTAILLTVSLLLSAPASAEAASRRPQMVTMSLASMDVTVGDSLTITGRLKPHSGNKIVHIQQRLAGDKKWTTLASVRTTNGGHYTAAAIITGDRGRQIRAYVPKSKRHRADYSPTRYLWVWPAEEVTPPHDPIAPSATVVQCEVKTYPSGGTAAVVRAEISDPDRRGYTVTLWINGRSLTFAPAAGDSGYSTQIQGATRAFDCAATLS